jgi:hypothetical protein
MGQVFNEDVHSPMENFWFNLFINYLLNSNCVSGITVLSLLSLPMPPPPLFLLLPPVTVYWAHMTCQASLQHDLIKSFQ